VCFGSFAFPHLFDPTAGCGRAEVGSREWAAEPPGRSVLRLSEIQVVNLLSIEKHIRASSSPLRSWEGERQGHRLARPHARRQIATHAVAGGTASSTRMAPIDGAAFEAAAGQASTSRLNSRSRVVGAGRRDHEIGALPFTCSLRSLVERTFRVPAIGRGDREAPSGKLPGSTP